MVFVVHGYLVKQWCIDKWLQIGIYFVVLPLFPACTVINRRCCTGFVLIPNHLPCILERASKKTTPFVR